MIPVRMLVKCVAYFIAFSPLTTATANEIQGRVIDSQTGEAIARARVTLEVFGHSNSGNAMLVVLTKPDGTFEVHNLPRSMCRIWSERPGFLGGDSRAESNTRIVLAD